MITRDNYSITAERDNIRLCIKA